MKARRTLFTTTLALITAFSASNTFAEVQTDNEALKTLTQQAIANAVTLTVNELNQHVKNDVLTTSYPVEVESMTSTIVAKVDAKEKKDEG